MTKKELDEIDTTYKSIFAEIVTAYNANKSKVKLICDTQYDEVLVIICGHYLSLINNRNEPLLTTLINVENWNAFWDIGQILYANPTQYNNYDRALFFDSHGRLIANSVHFDIIDYVLNAVLEQKKYSFEICLKIIISADANGEFIVDYAKQLADNHKDILVNNLKLLNKYCPLIKQNDVKKSLCEVEKD